MSANIYDEKNNGVVEIPQEPQSAKRQSSSIGGLEIEQEQKKIKKATYKESVINLFKAFVGSGVLAMPYAFYEGGYLLSAFIFILIGILINYSQIIVIRLSEQCPIKNANYIQLIGHSLGPKGEFACRVFLIIMQWGCCISYVNFFMRFLEYAIYDSDSAPIGRQLIYVAIAMCFIVPMALINNMAVFVKVSAFASLLILSALTCIILFALGEILEDTPDYQAAKSNRANFDKMPTTIGVAIYGFEAVGVLLSVKNSMVNPEKFMRLAQLVTLAIVVLISTFASICSVGFGAGINQIVLFSLPSRWYVPIVQIGYAIALAMSFPLQLLPAFNAAETFDLIQNIIRYGTEGYQKRRFIFRVIQIGIICFIALGIPQFAVFLSFIGGAGGSALQFVFPLLVYIQIYWHKAEQAEKITFSFCMGLGIILGAYAMVASFIDLVS